MELHLKVIGIILVLLAWLHVIFPRYFRWKSELSFVSAVNRQMMYVHAFFIAFGVFLMGVLCLTSSFELTTTTFGRRISLGLGIFWSVRLFFQFFGYTSVLWKGKTFETTVHVVFTVLWVYLSAIFLWVYTGW